MNLTVLPDRIAIYRLDPQTAIPAWAITSSFFSVTRTLDELSIVCCESDVCCESETAAELLCDTGWRAIKFEGPLDFALTGILVAVAMPLAAANVSIFAISTYDTDYVLVKESQLESAIALLSESGYVIHRS